MIRKIIFCFILSAFCTYAFGQVINKKDVQLLHNRIVEQLMKSSIANRQDIPSEMLLVIFRTDSVGRIAHVHCMADTRLHDSAYSALNRLQASDFKQWRVEHCRQRVIIVPVVSLGTGDLSDYAQKVFSDLFWENQRNGHILRIHNTTVITNIVVYIVPTAINEDRKEGTFIPTEKTNSDGKQY